MTLERVVHVDELMTRRYTFAEYKQIEAVNWSSLKHMRRSPLHFKAALEADRRDTPALRLGRAVHTAVFEPERLMRATAVWEGGDRRGKDWDRFKVLHAHQEILKVEEAERVIEIRDAVRSAPSVMPYLATGDPEHTILWRDQRSQVQCKGRLDWASDACVLDLKTARNATDPRAFALDAFKLGYFHQLAFYQRGLATIRGMAEGPPALVVAVEPEPPHDVVLYRLSEDALHFVNQHIDELLAKVVNCRETNTWPGFCRELEHPLDMPRWAYPSVEDMAIGPEADWIKGA